MSWLVAATLARILATDASPPPEVDDDQVLLIKRHDVVVGCGTGDAGVGGDASVPSDAPGDAQADAGPGDAGVDAGTDAGSPDAGSGCTMIPGDAITMIVQPRIHTFATGHDFALLYVTPSRPVAEVFADAFGSLPSITAPDVVVREVEVVDPSLGTQCREDEGCGGGGGGGGGGCTGGGTWSPPDYDGTDPDDGGVHVQTIGPYEILRAQPADRAELVGWLDDLGFVYEPADIDAIAPYVARGYHVVAVRLAANVVDAQTTSLALTWAGSDLRLPTALNASTHAGSTLTVYTAANGTYAFSSAKIIFSGLVPMSAMDMPSAYVTRMELTLAASTDPDADPIAERVLPDVEYRETIEKVHTTYVPPTVSCYEETEPRDDGGCCSDCNTAHRRVRLDMIVLALAVLIVTRRRRRR